MTHTTIIAHRGASGEFPENTLAAYRAAVEIGSDYFELDARLSREGVPVVMHDANVDRTTDGTGPVAGMTVDEIKRLDAGSWKDPRFAGQTVPTLEEVFAAFPTAGVVVELKSKPGDPPDLEDAVFEVIERHHAADRVIYCSFNPMALARVLELGTTSRIAPILHGGNTREEKRAFAGLTRVDALHPEQGQCSPRAIRWALGRGDLVNPWTVDDRDAMVRLLDRGATGISTNRPDVLMDLLKERV
jgi:glycerophosphoryl diester phosphodiesterase